MSSMLPRRISEMPSIDSDFDTPDKYQDNIKIKPFQPKRIADLLDDADVDSDEEKDDKLNCAILNDSFVLSPSKDLDIPPTPVSEKSNARVQPSAENIKNASNYSHDTGYVSRLSSMHINSSENEKATQSLEGKQHDRPHKARTQLFPTAVTSKSSHVLPMEKSREPLVPSVFQNRAQQAAPNFDPVRNPILSCPRVPLTARIPLSTKQDPESNSLETPLKKSEQNHFVTPSARQLAGLNSTTSAATCERDTNKRKILFTTPNPRLFSSGTSLANFATPVDVRQSQTQRKLSPIREPTVDFDKEKENTDEKILTINNIDYLIGQKIGSGGSSSVFLAKGRKSGKQCAIKLVNLDADPQTVEGYINETKLLARLQGNVNVISLYDYCHVPSNKTLYMVMEKGDCDLHKILQTYTSSIPLYKLSNYWYQMLQAVNYIHQNGVIHSDLKPANFLMINGRLKLIDFGIASNIAIESTSIIKFSQAGTFNYISPEALIDTSNEDSPSTHHHPRIRLSTKSDVWSLGCILYLLLYKKTPFSHIKNIPAKITAITSPSTQIDYPPLPNFYPPILLEMLKKCLTYNPKERSAVADLLKYPFDMLIPLEN